MIPVRGYAGHRVAVLGLGRSGLPSVAALEAGGAEVIASAEAPARPRFVTVPREICEVSLVRKMAEPPSWFMPASKLTRVRVEFFSNTIASVRSRSG